MKFTKSCFNIKIAFEALKKAAGDLTPFLEELHRMKQTNTLTDQNKEKFYSLLVSQREAFDKFYSDQIPYFRTVAEIFIDGMDTDDVLKLYQDIPSGQFTNPLLSICPILRMLLRCSFRIKLRSV